MVARAIGVKRQAITDLLRRYGRAEDQVDGWKKFSLGEAMVMSVTGRLIRFGIRPRLAVAATWMAEDMILAEATSYQLMSSTGPAPSLSFLVFEVINAAEGDEEFRISRITAEQAAKAIPYDNGLAIVMPLMGIADALTSMLPRGEVV
jgi:hypothetical protein